MGRPAPCRLISLVKRPKDCYLSSNIPPENGPDAFAVRACQRLRRPPLRYGPAGDTPGPIESGPDSDGSDSSGAERLALTGSVLPAGKRPAATRPTTRLLPRRQQQPKSPDASSGRLAGIGRRVAPAPVYWRDWRGRP